MVIENTFNLFLKYKKLFLIAKKLFLLKNLSNMFPN